MVTSLWGFFMGLRGPLLGDISGADPLTGHTLRGLAVTPAVPRLPWARDTPSRLDNGAARAFPRARAGGPSVEKPSSLGPFIPEHKPRDPRGVLGSGAWALAQPEEIPPFHPGAFQRELW